MKRCRAQACALLLVAERLVPAGAVPAALDRRRMQAGPAGDRGRRLAMAEVVVVAEPALEPGRVLGDARRRPGGVDDAAGLGEQPLGGVAVGADPLDVQIVGVLADREVHRAGQPGQVHVDLHLRPVLRLRLGDALRDELAEALRRVGLELDARARSSAPRGGRAPRASSEPPKWPPCASTRHCRPVSGSTSSTVAPMRRRLLHDPRLLELAGLEEPQDAAREARRRRPAEVVPERALAGLADLRGAEMRAEAGVGVRLVGGEDRVARRRGVSGSAAISRSSASCARRATSSTIAQSVSS